MRRHLVLTLAALAGASLIMGCTGCSSTAPAPRNPAAAAVPEFSVMSINLNHYQLLAPETDTESLAPLPPPSAAALIQAIRDASPGIIAIQEMGDPASWTDFKHRLRQAGLNYTYEEYLRFDPADRNLAVLSRYPILERQLHTNDLYTIGPTKFPLRRGIIELDIAIHPDYRLRLMNVHIKSKEFHEYGQAEMRRNESRLLGNHVRRAIADNPHVNLLVLGTFNDTPDSRSLREIHTYQGRELLVDLRPADAIGDAWTQRIGDDDHSRTDFLLCNQNLLNEVLISQTRLISTPQLLHAAPRRPLLATFLAADRSADHAPDLAARTAPAYTNTP